VDRGPAHSSYASRGAAAVTRYRAEPYRLRGSV
jgi:hypothetical protein